MYISNTVPTGTRNIKIGSQNFVKANLSPYIYIATVPNSFDKCGLKKHHFKLMPGSTFVDLVTVASFHSHLRRAVLFLSIPIFLPQNLRQITNHTPEQRLEQLLLTLRQNSQAYTDLADNLLPPDNTHPSLVQFDKPFPLACKSIWHAN